MKKHIISAITAAILLSSCHKPDPSKYVSTAFINANMLHGFAGRMLNDEMTGIVQNKKNGTARFTCTEFIRQQTDAATAALEKISELPETAEAAAMLDASKALFSFAVDVYNKEYRELALLYDQGADSATTNTKARLILQRYEERFSQLYNQLGEAGMAYAAKNNIRITNVQTSPGASGAK